MINEIWCWITSNHDALVVVFTFLIFIVTAALAIYTAKLWRSTGELVGDAKDTAKRQLRAYVFPINTILTRVAIDQIPEFHVTIKNSGQTPAYRVMHDARVVYGPYPLDPTQMPLLFGEIERLSKVNLGPGISLNKYAYGITVTAEIWNELQDHKTAYYAYGEIRFDDAFGEHRWIKYLVMVGGQLGIRADGFMGNCSDGNETSEDEETGLSPQP